MIEKLEIENFKSIKQLKIRPNRYNIFIGEPNTGKSNILEAISLAGWLGSRYGSLHENIRFQSIMNLFYDELIEDQIFIKINNLSVSLKYSYDQFNLKTKDNSIEISLNHKGDIIFDSRKTETHTFKDLFEKIKFFKYKEFRNYSGRNPDFLEPPNGINLFSVVYSKKDYRLIMKNFIKDFGYNLVFKPQEKTFEIQKQVEDTIISHPYTLASDTLKTIIFYVFAISSNSKSILLFEEPEAHAFPYYTKFIGEMIAKERSNQYFIGTHNPYFLTSIIEKAPKDLLNIYISYMRNYQTQVKVLEGDHLQDILDFDLDPFFNITSFYEE